MEDAFSGLGNGTKFDNKVLQTCQVQNLLDQNRLLISEIHQNRESKIRVNHSRNFGLIREFNNNLRRLMHLYSDLSNSAKWTTLGELGMDPDNKGIISDLLRYVGMKNLYKTIGKPWKRGYLLYDTPGSTDRWSLIAAMANRLEFDIYDLDLTGLTSIYELANVLVSIRKRSLIAIKDFDHWAGKLPDFKTEFEGSCLLEFVQCLVSSCGDEQIIVFATDNRDLHDAALQHPFNKCLHNLPKIALVSHLRKGRSQGTIAKAWTLRQGGGGPIDLSSSEFASANNKAQRVEKDKSSSATSDSKKKRTGEQEDCEEINTSITLDDLQQHYGSKRKDVAESLGVSVSTLKRICRRFGIKRWPNIIRRKKAGRPPDQYGEKNPSPTWKMLSTNGQTEMGNQMVGHLEETNEFLQDFVEGPNGGVSSEWAFEQNNQWTVSTSYPNSNGPEVPHPHIASTQILGENMESLGDRRNSFGSLEEHLLRGHISGSMWTVPPCSDPVSSQHMPTITPTMGSSEDRINSLAFIEDVFLEEDDSGSIRWTIPTCSEPTPSQLMPTVPWTTGITDDLRNLLPSVEESFSTGDVSGFINRTVPSCSYPALSQPMSTVPHTTGSSDDLRNLLASVKEPIWAGRVSESINLTVPSCSNPAPSQSMPSILHTMPTNPRMMPLLIERQDTRSVNLKATYGDTTIKFQFPLTSGINELKEEVSKILECKLDSFNIEYKDEDGDWILMARDENVREYLQLLTSLGNQVTKLKVRDKVSDTTNF